MIARLLLAALVFAGTLCVPGRIEAIPVFAHRYGFTCQTCHTAVPHLNAFGQAFLDNGYRVTGLAPKPVVPLAMKVQLAYSSDPAPDGLPKAVVDEVELLSGGSLGSRGSYFVEAYVIDGGKPGALRDAWAALAPRGEFLTNVRAGQFTVPLPVDPETFRETQTHYAVWDQAIGANPFTFFAPHAGVEAVLGKDGATSLHLLALSGHDKQSGIPASGIDTMLYAQHAAGPFTASAYRYDGTRPGSLAPDRFSRQGYGLTYAGGPLELAAVLQKGADSNADGLGTSVASSGGFVQARYAFSDALFAIARLDGTNDATNGFYRGFVTGIGRRLTRNTRITFEDLVTHQPATHHTFSTALLLAY